MPAKIIEPEIAQTITIDDEIADRKEPEMTGQKVVDNLSTVEQAFRTFEPVREIVMSEIALTIQKSKVNTIPQLSTLLLKQQYNTNQATSTGCANKMNTS